MLWDRICTKTGNTNVTLECMINMQYLILALLLYSFQRQCEDESPDAPICGMSFDMVLH